MSESRVNDRNYICIQGWMIRQLHLKGNELIVYAIIYGFTQAENHAFTGGLQYLADWTNSTKQSMVKCLKSLAEKGYITKKEDVINGVKFCSYYATKFNGVLNFVEQGMQQSLTGGIKQSLPNNIDMDIIDDTISKRKMRFVPPTVEEVAEYCRERGNGIDAQSFVDFYESKGWMIGRDKMKSWKAAVRTWENRRKAEQPKSNLPTDADYDW